MVAARVARVVHGGVSECRFTRLTPIAHSEPVYPWMRRVYGYCTSGETNSLRVVELQQKGTSGQSRREFVGCGDCVRVRVHRCAPSKQSGRAAWGTGFTECGAHQIFFGLVSGTLLAEAPILSRYATLA
jgi:hypothetical protein